MKKIRKILLLLIILLFNTRNAYANTTGTLKRFYVDNYYYVMTSTNYYRSFEIPFYTLDDNVVYCIEPGTSIKTWNYIGDNGFTLSPYSAEINSKLELIGHYGYGYFNHDTLNYRIATQALIWETLGKNIEFYTKQYGYGDIIDVSKEKNEIMSLVNKHKVLPSFSDNLFIGNINEELVLTDNNGVLNDYEVYYTNGDEVKIIDNKLYIKLLSAGTYRIELRRKKYDNLSTMIYAGDDGISQKVAMFRASDDVKAFVNFEVAGAKIRIIHKDRETNSNIKIKGIKFKIKNIDTDNYICENTSCTFETDKNGEILTKKVYVGNFIAEEVRTQELYGYLWNDEILEFTIDHESGSLHEIIFESNRPNGTLKLNLTGESIRFDNNSYLYEEVLLEDAIYGLYANEDIYNLDSLMYKKDELIQELPTDSEGNIYFENLLLGKYYVKQITSSLDNMIDSNKYLFEIEYQDDTTEIIFKEISLKNFLPKATLLFLKTDLESGVLLENALIEIYSLKYNEVVYNGYTDSNGEISISNLPLGKYEIRELESPDGYEISNDIMKFELTENNEIVKVGLTNKIVVNIPDTSLNEINLTILGTLLMFISFVWCLYEKKK